MLINDPRVLAVPVRDCAERLVDARDMCPEIRPYTGGKDHYDRPREESFYVREDVARRLSEAQRALPAPFRLELFEGWRSVTLQEVIYADYIAHLERKHPHLTTPALAELAAEFVAPPSGTPPHSTGGAVDIQLLVGGELADLGCPINWPGPERRMDADVSEGARKMREVLATACLAAGFENYDQEWWHWSYGDQYWAAAKGCDSALYGAVAPEIAVP